MQILDGKKVVTVVYICHVSLLENHDLRCCIEKRDILQTRLSVK